MRMLGMHGAAFANYAVEDCDFLMAVGARFDDRVAGNPPKFAKRREVHRASRHRRLGDQQGQARRLEPRGPDAGCARETSSTTAGARGSSSEWPRMARALRGAAPQPRDELRPRQRADPAVLRDRGDQPAHAAARRSSRPAWASIRCGRRSTSISAARGCGSPRAAWEPWDSDCRPRSARSSRSASGS